MRAIEVMDIITCAEMIIHSCMARKASNKWMDFERLDYPEDDPTWYKFVTAKLEDDKVKVGEVPVDYHGPLSENYEVHKK